MGISLIDTWSAAKQRTSCGGGATEGHSGQYVYVPNPMVCDPPISSPMNSSTAHDEGNGKKRVDAAAPGQDNAAWLPPTRNCSHSSVFNFTSFAMFLQTVPADGGENNIQDFRKFGVIDMIRFFEEQNEEFRKATTKYMEELHSFYRSQIAMLKDQHQQQVTEIESRSMSKVKKLSLSLESASKQLSDAEARVNSTKSSLTAAESQLQDRNKVVRMMQGELDKVKAQNGSLSKSRDEIRKEMNAMKADVEVELNHSLEAEQAKDREVHRLNSIRQEKDKGIGEEETVSKLPVSECQKLKGQLATIELKSAQESLARGSFADDQAYPVMLDSACQSVDRTMDNLVRYLHEKSISSKFSLKAPQLEYFITSISRAKPADFTRPAQVKYVWGHWICANMFQGFEHVFFGLGEEWTSPLHSKEHATECFRSFQEKKSISPSDFYKRLMTRSPLQEKVEVLSPVNTQQSVKPVALGVALQCGATYPYKRLPAFDQIYLRARSEILVYHLLRNIRQFFDA